MQWRFLSLLLLAGASLRLAAAGADGWLTNSGAYPNWVNAAPAAGFETLRCEAVAGKLKVSWPAAIPTNTQVLLYASFDAPGHWLARDWRSTAMIPRPGSWDVSLPVLDLDIPVVYFLATHQPGGGTNYSPLRVCHPRAAGLEEPSRPFWPFLEGFEEGLESWRVLGPATNPPALAIGAPAVNGYGALKVRLPGNRRTATVATTVLRGWHLTRFSAKGLQLWARTSGKQGRAAFALMANAGTTNQTVFACPNQVELGPVWQKIELVFEVVPELARPEVDLFTIEFSGEPAQEFWLDNLSLLGRGRLELE